VVEISRRKSNTDIFDEMFDKCPVCYNGGLVKSVPLICSEIYFASDLDKRIDYVSINSCNPEEYSLEVVE